MSWCELHGVCLCEVSSVCVLEVCDVCFCVGLVYLYGMSVVLEGVDDK